MARITFASWQGIVAKLPWNYGKAQAGSTRFIYVWLKMALTVSLLTFLWEHPSAEADWIEAMARNLSEGDGINFQAIPCPFSSDAPRFIAATQQGINFSNTTLVFHLIEANGLTDLSPTFIHEYITNGGLSLIGPFQLRLGSDTIGTGLYQHLWQDRFIFANHHLIQSWELEMIVLRFFGPWSSGLGATSAKRPMDFCELAAAFGRRMNLEEDDATLRLTVTSEGALALVRLLPVALHVPGRWLPAHVSVLLNDRTLFAGLSTW